jgi:hypothetical protein
MPATNIVNANSAYEEFLATELTGGLVKDDLAKKHKRMAESAFRFLRATYWRWSETILEICPTLKDAHSVLAIGDIHLENYGTWRDEEGRLVWGVNDFDEVAEMPYVLDLVRLAVSAVLSRPQIAAAEQQRLCADILDGYLHGLAKPHAILLEQDYGWLRERTVCPEDKRAKFWEDMNGLQPPHPSDHASNKPYVEVLHAALPPGTTEIKIAPRVAGGGSLGRPRWVASGQWSGGGVVREAKALVPSGWVRAHGGKSNKIRTIELATGCFRAPDPHYRLGAERILVRRLSPNNRKIEEDDRIDLLGQKVLHAMGRDLACVHLGRGDHHEEVKRDLDKRKANWLLAPVEKASAFVQEEYEQWKQYYKTHKADDAKNHKSN